MEKGNITVTVIIATIALIAIGLNITGFAINAQDAPEISVSRPPIIKNETENTTIVQLTVISSGNVISIEETLIPEDCEILDTYSEPEIDIFDLNDVEKRWTIANRSDTLNIDIYYILTYECDIDKKAGKVFMLTDDNRLSSGDDDTPDDPSTGGNGGSGGGNGGSTGSSSTKGLQSVPIQQTNSEKEFEETINEAIKNILGVDESKEVDVSSFITWIVLAFIIVAILITIAYSIFKKPQAFPKKQLSQKPSNLPQAKRPVQTFK